MEKDDTVPHVIQLLNTLLKVLNVPILLTSPLDLIPSLLIAILDPLTGDTLSSTSTSPLLEWDSSNRSTVTDRLGHITLKKETDIQRVKVFLGVMEHDLIGEDVGLNRVDPVRLVDGEWEEAFFIAKVLCWFGWKRGLIPELRLPATSSTRTTDISIDHTISTSFINAQVGSMTSYDMNEYTGDTPSDSFSFLPEPRSPFMTHIPLGQYSDIIPSRSLLNTDGDPANMAYNESRSLDNTYGDTIRVRYEGYIEPADENLEISWYEKSSQSISFPNKSSRSLPKNLSREIKRTSLFLEKRADILSELQELIHK